VKLGLGQGRSATATARTPRSATGHFIIGLDGLRALAVASVVIYHLGAEWLPGGFLGVDIFFVISGFLITTLLFGEIAKVGNIRFGQFYLRRARRLLPALFLTLGLTAFLVATVARDAAAEFVKYVPGALVYASNWWSINAHQSYFELIGRGNPLAHLWSLAVEEQFYLIWPAILGLALFIARKFGLRLRTFVFVVAFGGALLSTVWMGWLSHRNGYPLDADPTRVYFGTDSHAMSVLVGAALATMWQPLKMRKAIPTTGRIVITGVGVLALLATCWFLLNVSEYTPWLYRGGFLVAALVFAVLVAAATHPASLLGAGLQWRPFVWVGERSYGIYLYHWPIFLVTRPGTDIPWDGLWVQFVRVGLVLAVADVSYRFVEVPIRQGALGRMWHAYRATITAYGLTPTLRVTERHMRIPASIALVLVVVTGFGLSSGLATDASAQAHLGAGEDPTPTPTAPATTPPISRPTTKPSVTPARTAAPSKAPAVAVVANVPSVITGKQVSWFGDSVSLWAATAIAHQLPGVTVDAGLNRSPGFIQGRVMNAKSRHTLRPVVVMHLGDAGPVEPGRLDRTLKALQDRYRIVLVNSTARFAWVPSSNVTLKNAAAKYRNVVLADWHSYSKGHRDWFKDGLHCSTKGKPIFAKFIGKIAVSKNF
jgi:peptidoglycan/LPS O-acetylase OafA/YrhL